MAPGACNPTTFTANQKQRAPTADVVDLDLADTIAVEDADNLDFLDDGSLDLLPPPPPADAADAAVADTGRGPVVCPHCTGERTGFGRYRERDKPRATNQLRKWNHTHGYSGPPYCKACSESFRSHLLRPGRNPRNGCSRMRPCSDCAKVLAHFGDQSPADVFARFDAARAVRGPEHQGSAVVATQLDGCARPTPIATPISEANGVMRHPSLPDSKRRKVASALAVALCVVGTVTTSWRQTSLAQHNGNSLVGAARQLRALNGSSAALLDRSAETLGGVTSGMSASDGDAPVCRPSSCNKLPAVPAWVPLRFMFPYFATDYSVIAKPSPGALSTAHVHAFMTLTDRFARFHGPQREYYVGSYWDGRHEHQGTFRPIKRCQLLQHWKHWKPSYSAVQPALGALGAAGFLRVKEAEEPPQDDEPALHNNDSDGENWFEHQRQLPSPPHMRTGILLVTPATTLVIAAGCFGSWGAWWGSWKTGAASAAVIHWMIRPMLALAIAALADVLDPSLEFGIKHEL